MTQNKRPAPDGTRDIALTAQQAHYILENLKLDTEIRELVGGAVKSGFVRLSQAQRRDLLAALGAELQRSGFDAQYSPTNGGQLAEAIVDLLTVESE